MLAFLTLAVVLAAAKAEPEINGGHCCPEREKQTILSTFHFSSCLLFFFFLRKRFCFQLLLRAMKANMFHVQKILYQASLTANILRLEVDRAIRGPVTGM